MSHHADRTAPADVDTSSQRHLHVKSFAKMESPAQQRQQHEQHHQHQEQIPMCESPSPKIKRKIGNEVTKGPSLNDVMQFWKIFEPLTLMSWGNTKADSLCTA
jgi:hypothetical protein